MLLHEMPTENMFTARKREGSHNDHSVTPSSLTVSTDCSDVTLSSTNDTQILKWNVSFVKIGEVQLKLSFALFLFLFFCRTLASTWTVWYPCLGLYDFQRVSLPSSSAQMTGMISPLSLMCFSPLTLILTLYKAISINLPNTSTCFSSQSC